MFIKRDAHEFIKNSNENVSSKYREMIMDKISRDMDIISFFNNPEKIIRSINISDKNMEQCKYLIEKGLYTSISEIMRSVIREYLASFVPERDFVEIDYEMEKEIKFLSLLSENEYTTNRALARKMQTTVSTIGIYFHKIRKRDKNLVMKKKVNGQTAYRKRGS